MATGLTVPLVGSAQLQEVEKKKTEKYAAEEGDPHTQSGLDTGLGAFIRRAWERARRAKHEVNYRLLDCLRARKGEYSIVEIQKVLAYGSADPIYLKLTGTKCRAAASWVRDILIPPRDRPWELAPTPIPDLDQETEKKLLTDIVPQALMNLAQQGVQLNEVEMHEFKQQIRDKILHELNELAKDAVDNMEKRIEDLMVDGDFTKALEEFIEDFVTYPFAVLKGPYYKTKKMLEWKGGKPTPTNKTVLAWRRVSPFDIFYSPYAKTTQDGYLIERLRYTEQTLYDLIGLPGYREDHIRAVLELHKYGNLRDWIWEDFERDYLENNSPYFLSDRDTIDGLHFWGYVQGKDLIHWGYKDREIDELATYPVDAILVGKHVIRVVINDNPMGWRPYHSACWDAVPSSIIGVSLPEQMMDHQRIVNATARALMSNLSIASGPQAVVLTDMLAEGENITNIYPYKIWQMRSSITGNAGKPVDFFQPEMQAETLLGIINTFEAKADDVTNVPRYSYGNEKVGGAGTTATGLSMLMNSAAKGIRRAIANIDLNVIQPTIYQTFVELMTNDPDPAIKGDINVVARGSAAMLIREQLQQNQKEFLQMTANPIDMQIIGVKGRAALLGQLAEELGLEHLGLPSEHELEQMDEKNEQQNDQLHAAEVAGQSGQGQGPDPQVLQQLQEQAHEMELKNQQLDQEAQQLDQIQKQVAMKDKQVQRQAQALDQEMKKLAALKSDAIKAMDELRQEQVRSKALKEQLLMEVDQKSAKEQASIDAEKSRLQAEREKTVTAIGLAKDKAMAEIEKGKMTLDMAISKAEILDDESESESKSADNKKPGITKPKTNLNSTIKEVLAAVAKNAKLQNIPKNIVIQRDSEGRISGATVKPVESDVGTK